MIETEKNPEIKKRLEIKIKAIENNEIVEK